MRTQNPPRALIACLLVVSAFVAMVACKPGTNANIANVGGDAGGSDALASANTGANAAGDGGAGSSADPASNGAENNASDAGASDTNTNENANASNAMSNAASSGNDAAPLNNAADNGPPHNADTGEGNDADNGDGNRDDDGGTRTVPIQDPPTNEEGVVARVSFTKGRNLVYRADDSIERAEVDLALFEGDRIEVSSRGNLTLVYAESGLFQPVGAGEEVTITAAINDSEQAQDMDKVNEYLADTLIEGEGGTTLAAVGGTRARRDPRRPFPLSPRNSALMPGAVTFTWQAPDALGGDDGDEDARAEYRLRVLREGEVIHSVDTTATSVTIQPSTLRFEPGALYMWYVTLADDLEEPTFKPCFQPLTDADAQALRAQLDANAALISDPGDGTAHMLNGLALERALAFNAALEEYTAAYALSPGDAGVIGRLRRVYRAMNWVTDDTNTVLAALAERYPAEDE